MTTSADVAEQENQKGGDFVWLAEFSHRHRPRCHLAPIVLRAVELLLSDGLALGLGPADVDPVDAGSGRTDGRGPRSS